MGEITNTGGGVLVPEVLQSRYVDVLAKHGKFRSNSTILPIESASVLVPMISADCSVVCTGEGQTINTSSPTFSQLRMTPKTWATLVKVSNEIDEDTVVAVGVILGISMLRSFSKMEDSVGFLGDGSAAYFGMKGIIGAFHFLSDTISEIAGLKVATGNAWGEITLADFQNTVALLPADFDDGAKWYVSKKFFYNVMWRLAETAGVAGIYEILSDKKSRHFLGYPVEFVSCMPAAEANSQICAILGDLSVGSYLAQRKELTLQRSTDVYFANNQLAVRGIERVDVNVFGCGDKTNPGPIVGLITAAS
jgi:HK97 family phage major capsid protein